jgi:hypothetical protein
MMHGVYVTSGHVRLFDSIHMMKPLLFGATAMLVLAGVIVLVVRQSTVPEPAARSDEPAAETAAPEPAEPAPPPKTTRPRPSPPAPAASRPVAPPRPVGATLVLTSDVPGASVFIDREFVGTTPLRLEALEPGRTNLRLAAEGYEGVARTVDLSAGENPVTVRFREVRLNERIAVVHRHGIGSCEGTLVATVDGLAYQTSNQNDAFTLSFDQLETFEVNYLERNLRVRQRGGRTRNFTGRAGADADALFVFHRDVQAARDRLAKGYAPVR